MPQRTTNPLSPLIGHRAMRDRGHGSPLSRLLMLVDVLDSRQCWDRVDCFVRPVAGDGTAWVSCDRLAEPTVEQLRMAGAAPATPKQIRRGE